MVGPRPATTVPAPSARMAETASPITPATSPRHPTWTAPWTPSGEPSATGAQSAVRTATHDPGPAATTASASGPRPSAPRPPAFAPPHLGTDHDHAGAVDLAQAVHGEAGGHGTGGRDGTEPALVPGGQAGPPGPHRRGPQPDCARGGDAGISEGRRGRRTRRHRGSDRRPRWVWRRCPRARSSRPSTWLRSADLGSPLRPSSQRSKPAAITVTRTSSPIDVVDDLAEDDVGVGVGHAVDDLRGLVHLEQAEVRCRRRC